MQILAWLLFMLVSLGVVSYFRLKMQTATLVMAVAFLLGSAFGIIGTFSWLLFLLIAVPLNIDSVRKDFITAPLLNMYKKIMPEMSDTEQDAIDAGTVWWDGQIFSGKPDWHMLHSIPEGQLTAEEQAFLDGPVEKACQMSDDWDIHHNRAALAPEIWEYLKNNKFFAMIIKRKYGGLEFSAYAQSRILQKLSGVNSVLATTVGVPNSLGPGELLQHYGTKEQQDYYLPRLANGEEIPCFALTSPEAGSDAGSISDKGIVCKGTWEGKEVLGMRLTFNKRYITLAPVATVVGLAFKLYDPEGLLGGEEELGITCALIPRETKGLDIGRRHFPLNVPFQNGPIRGEDIFVPLDYIIGGTEMAGQGWRMLVECLSVGRCITLPSNAAGGAKSVAMVTGAYAYIRRQFKLPIGKMEGIEEVLGRIGGNAYMMDAVTRMSTKAVDLGEKPSVISAICKYHLTEKARMVINDAMDVHGGKGIMLGPNNYLGRGYQASPIGITVEGANILTRNMMIYGQGAMRCHPYVLRELQAASLQDRQQSVDAFDDALFGHIGFAISNVFRSLWFSLTGARFTQAPFIDDTARYYRSMERYSTNMAMLSDICMAMFGGELKRKERMSARLGDLLSYLYIASCTLKRFNDEGRQAADLPLLHWAVQDNLFKLETSMQELLDNMPGLSGLLLKLFICPFGKSYKRPADKLDHQIAGILQTPGESLNRLCQGQYLTREPGNLLGEMNQTLDDVIASEPLVKKVAKALGKRLRFNQLDKIAEMGLEAGVLNQQEAELLKRTEIGRFKAISVDDFDADELMADKSLAKPKRSTRKASTRKNSAPKASAKVTRSNDASPDTKITTNAVAKPAVTKEKTTRSTTVSKAKKTAKAKPGAETQTESESE